MPVDILSTGPDRELLLNGETVPKNDHWDGIEEGLLLGGAFELSVCPYCGSRVHSFSDRKIGRDPERSSENLLILECPRCAHWQGLWYYDCGICSALTCELPEWEAQMAKVAEFPESLPPGCATELADYLRRHPHYWHSLDTRRMEQFVAQVYQSNHASSEVMHVGRPYDGGVDVLFVDSGKKRWLIQVKRRESPHAVEGVSAVRNILGVMLLNETARGVVVSTADHFSYQARREAMKAKALGYRVDLIDRGRLDRMLDSCLPVQPWVDFVERRKPDAMKRVARRLPDRRQMTFWDLIAMDEDGRACAGTTQNHPLAREPNQ